MLRHWTFWFKRGIYEQIYGFFNSSFYSFSPDSRPLVYENAVD